MPITIPIKLGLANSLKKPPMPITIPIKLGLANSLKKPPMPMMMHWYWYGIGYDTGSGMRVSHFLKKLEYDTWGYID